jgi:hypothetical protein
MAADILLHIYILKRFLPEDKFEIKTVRMKNKILSIQL